MSTKVVLRVRKRNPYAVHNERSCETDLKRSLPFYKSNMGSLVHRVRSGTMYWWDGEYRHTALQLWCGASGFPGSKGTFLALPADGEKLCQACERKGKPAPETTPEQAHPTL